MKSRCENREGKSACEQRPRIFLWKERTAIINCDKNNVKLQGVCKDTFHGYNIPL